jgi:single-strand DNA-binding protein
MTNHITLIGNVTRDPELRFTTSGQARTMITVATNRRFQAKGATEPTEITAFFSVVAWGQLAEHSTESLRKGDRVTVSGRVDHRKWVDADGQNHDSFDVIADDVALSLRFRTAEVDRTRRETPAAAMVDAGVGSSADRSVDEPREPDAGLDDSSVGLSDPSDDEHSQLIAA